MSRRRRTAATKEQMQRATMVRRVAEILDDPDAPSRFAHEGACRHGLRSAFCLAGAKWDVADNLAASIVLSALASIGARRPTWEQGQPEHCQDGIILIERWYCAHCGGPMPEDERRLRYCSDLCGAAAYQHRARITGIRQTMTEYRAALAARAEHDRQQREMDCEQCGRPFTNKRPGSRRQQYCSHECYARSKVGRYRLRKKTCKQCGAKYQPWKSTSVFCGAVCYKASKALPDIACGHCGKEFKPKNHTTKFCSVECQAAGHSKVRPEIQCPMCLAIFRQPLPSRPRIYCSRGCAVRARFVGAPAGKEQSAPAQDEQTTEPPPIMLAAE